MQAQDFIRRHLWQGRHTPAMPDDEILRRLLALNLARAAAPLR